MYQTETTRQMVNDRTDRLRQTADAARRGRRRRRRWGLFSFFVRS
jgi:hypothetical protein